MQVVKVIWEDARSLDEWVHKADAGEVGLIECETVGFLLEKTKKVVRLVTTTSEEDGIAGVWVIPTSCVKKIQVMT